MKCPPGHQAQYAPCCSAIPAIPHPVIRINTLALAMRQDPIWIKEIKDNHHILIQQYLQNYIW